uniref:CCHC-type domain-containing protein n=1 Tax=Meloidogyne incognita TaxID=6306 RepID=A0A914NKD3_MELIC
MHRSLKTKNDEIFTQIEEIRNARHEYEERMKDLDKDERAEFDRTLRASVDLQEAYHAQRLGKKRHAKYAEIIDQLEIMLGNGNGNGSTRKKGIVLPKLELKQFEGEEWENFWPLFEATIHNDNELDPIQKMSYLESLLVDEPKKVVQGLLPYSEANYNLAVDLLKAKYGKDEKIIRDLHNKLSCLPESRTVEDDIQLQVEVERICRQLEHYKQDLRSPQIFLGLEQKMSKKVLHRYLDLKQLDGNIIWTTELYRKYYAKAVEHCQMLTEIYQKGKKEKQSMRKDKEYRKEPSSSTMNFAIRYQGHDSKRNWRENKQRPERSNRATERFQDEKHWKRRPYRERDYSTSRSSNEERSGSSSTSRSPARYPCQFCQGKHFPLDCKKYRTNEERVKQIQRLALCYQCLRKGHNSKECPKYRQACFLCKGKHNVALCEKRSKKEEHVTSTVSETEENESETNKALAITSLGCMKKQEEIFTLLKCIKVTIYNPQKTHLKKRVIAFLDPGSERSYISEELGKGLELEK